MKVIDLLNKIANGEEVPKKIQVYSDIFVFDDSNGVYEHEETRTQLLSIYNGNILNYEVRIKEDKKIRKLDWIEENTFDKMQNSCLTAIEKELLDSNFKELGNKINEIIEVLNERDIQRH